jgi:hypothetical protein
MTLLPWQALGLVTLLSALLGSILVLVGVTRRRARGDAHRDRREAGQDTPGRSRLSRRNGVLVPVFPVILLVIVWASVARGLPREVLWSGGALILVAATMTLHIARPDVGDG